MIAAPDGDLVHDALSSALSAWTGLTFAPYRREEIASVTTRLMRRSRVSDVGEYVKRLRSDPALLDSLLLELTVGETYFFRDEPQFDLLRNEILPEVARTHDEPVRIWSAGCATGEEPYSLAIVLHQLGLASRGEIVGTDLCRVRLVQAARGQFGAWSLRRTPDDILRAHFARTSAAVVDLDPRIRDRVSFAAHNLADPDDPPPWLQRADVVVCRNVLIYFRPEMVAVAARQLLSALRPGGWLVLGVSDPFLGDMADCEVITTGAGLVYRRRPRHARPPRDAHAARPAPVAPPASTYATPQRGAPAAAPARLEAAAPAPAVERIRTLIRERDLVTAGRACAAALDHDRATSALHYLHAVLLAAGGHHAQSLVAARRVLYLERHSPLGHLVLARARAALGDAVRAQRAYRRAEQLLEGLPPGHPLPAVEGDTAADLLRLVRASLLSPDR